MAKWEWVSPGYAPGVTRNPREQFRVLLLKRKLDERARLLHNLEASLAAQDMTEGKRRKINDKVAALKVKISEAEVLYKNVEESLKVYMRVKGDK